MTDTLFNGWLMQGVDQNDDVWVALLRIFDTYTLLTPPWHKMAVARQQTEKTQICVVYELATLHSITPTRTTGEDAGWILARAAELEMRYGAVQGACFQNSIASLAWSASHRDVDDITFSLGDLMRAIVAKISSADTHAESFDRKDRDGMTFSQLSGELQFACTIAQERAVYRAVQYQQMPQDISREVCNQALAATTTALNRLLAAQGAFTHGHAVFLNICHLINSIVEPYERAMQQS